LGSKVWDLQRQLALSLEGVIIIIDAVDWKVTIKRVKKGLVTPVSGSPDGDQGLIRRSLNINKLKLQSSSHSQSRLCQTIKLSQ
jgi:hypothetical protein